MTDILSFITNLITYTSHVLTSDDPNKRRTCVIEELLKRQTKRGQMVVKAN